MKIFVSYRFTGENPDILKEEMTSIRETLEKNGNQVSCSFWTEKVFREEKYSNKQILEHALKELEGADIMFVYIKSDQKSEGMLLEIGYALHLKKKIILAIKKDTKTTFVREMSDKVIEFTKFNDLLDKLEKEQF